MQGFDTPDELVDLIDDPWVGGRSDAPERTAVIESGSPQDNAYVPRAHAMPAVTLAPTTASALSDFIVTGERPAVPYSVRLHAMTGPVIAGKQSALRVAMSGDASVARDNGRVTRSVLFIEDDQRIRRAVAMALRADGFEVTEAATGEEGLFALAERDVGVVLLDIMLPDLDGFEVCRRIRRRSDAPVIMVTAMADSHDVVAGLEAGADDYITKPFVPKELAARIRALLRRTNASTTRGTVVVGGLEISPQQGVVTRNGQVVNLTRTEFDLLCELAAEPGRVRTREELLERVWGYDYFGDERLVDVHVRRLRTKVEADPALPEVVKTVRGVGYRLAVDPQTPAGG